MTPTPDHGEESYAVTGRLTGRRAVITGADSGIGKAVAIAFAREGADALVSYLSEAEDETDTADRVQRAGRKAVVVGGDLSSPLHCHETIDAAVQELTGIDILVSNAAFQMSHETIEEIPDEDWDITVATNLSAFFHLTKAALPQMGSGASIIATTSINYQQPSPQLLPYAATKSGIANMVASLAQALADRGIRVNGVAPSCQPRAVARCSSSEPAGLDATDPYSAPAPSLVGRDRSTRHELARAARLIPAKSRFRGG